MKPARLLLLGFMIAAWMCMAAESPRPNVLFIIVDDLNDWVGPWGGHPQVKTPSLDRLAKRGVVFTQAYCAAPLCNPSRSALFSGRHPFETGIFDNKDAGLRKLHPELVLLPDHFRSAGYRTLGSGKLLHQKVTGWFDEEFFPEQRWSPFSPKQVDYTPDELSSKGSDNPCHVTTLKGKATVLPFNRMPSGGRRRNPSFSRWVSTDRTFRSTSRESILNATTELNCNSRQSGRMTWTISVRRAVHWPCRPLMAACTPRC